MCMLDYFNFSFKLNIGRNSNETIAEWESFLRTKKYNLELSFSSKIHFTAIQYLYIIRILNTYFESKLRLRVLIRIFSQQKYNTYS